MPRNTTRRDVLAAAAAASLMAPTSVRAAPAKRPNIVFILADDLGYADLSCYQSRHIKTPVLDRLARQGARLTNAYANTAVCSPSRLALITGRYPCRFPGGLIEPFHPGPWGKGAIPNGYPTLPKRLKALGYRTALVGKWHLGPFPEVGPLANGYDNFFGFYDGVTDYFTHETGNKPALVEGTELVHVDGYLTNLFADHAIARVREWAHAPEKPFFLSLHFNAPHAPWEGPTDLGLGTQSAHYDGGSLKVYASMVEAMDAQIGRVLASLEQTGAAKDTLVIFTSDNGGERFSEVWPFRGAKGLLLEGGIRVPAIVRWPSVLRAGTVSDQPAITFDFTASMLDAAGAPTDPGAPLDGLSLWSPLASGAIQPRTLFWRYTGHDQAALRDGDWKYYRMGTNEFLYDLSADTTERANLAHKQPEKMRALKAKWSAINGEMLPETPDVGFCMSPTNLAAELPITPGDGCHPPGAQGGK